MSGTFCSRGAAASTAPCARSSAPRRSPSAPLFPGADGLSFTFADGARLIRDPNVAVRVDGHFIGPGCDLVHGDVIEIAGPTPVRLEVD